MFLNALKKLSIFFFTLFLGNICYAQNNEPLIKISDLDSLHNQFYGQASEEAYLVHNKLLRQSKKLSYDQGILSAYKSLIWYYGVSAKANIDSVLHYADLFETKVITKSIKADTLLIKALKLPQYYLNKGQILANGFGLPEQGLESYFKVYPLISEGDTKLFIAYNVSIAEIYYHKFQYDKALEVLTPLLKDTVGVGSFTKKYY
ncbi:hypothetical protein ADIWIN_0600 [Winogradskyella psychrotolerans RS-3]|uniref:Uncharacterized protein n=1 Tax=Winogradskyella psychrotolerans RS-3 TaxID=641526 RepID=S7X614_9FLAO|nr:hypothetical protein ADIWIN_0600 [Winogradskyella psychrotolerans RS-3]